MSELITVRFSAALAADDAEGGRRVRGRVVPYGPTAESPFRGVPAKHRFEPGAFTRSLRERGNKLRLFYGHDTTRMPLGRASELTESADGVDGVFELARTAAADEALELVRSGLVSGFSAGIAGVRWRRDGETIVHLETALFEVSLVAEPAFAEAAAAVFGVPDLSHLMPTTVAARRLSLLEKDH